MSGPGAADQRAFEEYLGGVGIWRSDRPEGPFTWVGFGPQPGGYGSWNDGGTSGGSVRMLGSGVWEMWFSGAKMRKNSRILPREEDGGVAYSLDGVNWESGVKLCPDLTAESPSRVKNPRSTLPSCSELWRVRIRLANSGDRAGRLGTL